MPTTRADSYSAASGGGIYAGVAGPGNVPAAGVARTFAMIGDSMNSHAFGGGAIRWVNAMMGAPFTILANSAFNGRTLAGNCDLCFLKPAAQVSSLIAEKPQRATFWIRMEALALALASKPSGAVFRSDRPSYAAMLQTAQTQVDFIGHDEEALSCFCGD